ncbi:MAG TPA: sucrase ferredoxin [Mycobacteriales bacterium]|jgi:hypothetical protein|nr:sucrase ferredoxin [Mycobacteriales bacterium]
MDDWCATTSAERGEPLAATASRVERWLLVEHSGAWGPESVPSSRLPVGVARALAATAARAGARLLMIRRHHGEVSEGYRQVYAVDSRPGSELVLGRRAQDDDLLALDLPFDPDSDTVRGWTAVDGPLLLVCTHGRHDRCCATRGRPVAHALYDRWPGLTWECSHVGGDRFAANLLVLPEGLYLGRVQPDEVVGMVAGLQEGRLPAGRVRGRSSLPLPTQAAQEFARQSLDRWRTDDLVPLAQEHAGRDLWRVRLSGGPGGAPVDVVVRYDRAGDGAAHVLTCGAAEQKTAAVFRLADLTVLSGPDLQPRASPTASSAP